MNTQDDNISAKEMTPEPTPTTREALIERLIDDRLGNWDSSDAWDALYHGRYGYSKLTNAALEEMAEEWGLEENGQEAHYRITDTDTSKTPEEEIIRELLNALIDAQDMLGYHAPEKFDDAIHEANWIAKMNAIQAAIVKAKGR